MREPSWWNSGDQVPLKAAALTFEYLPIAYTEALMQDRHKVCVIGYCLLLFATLKSKHWRAFEGNCSTQDCNLALPNSWQSKQLPPSSDASLPSRICGLQVEDLASSVIRWIFQEMQRADSPQTAALLFQTFEAWMAAGCLYNLADDSCCLGLINLAFQALEQPHASEPSAYCFAAFLCRNMSCDYRAACELMHQGSLLGMNAKEGCTNDVKWCK